MNATRKCSYCEERKPAEQFIGTRGKHCAPCREMVARAKARKDIYRAQPLGGKPRRWAAGA